MPNRSHSRTTGSETRSRRLYRFCTDTTATISRRLKLRDAEVAHANVAGLSLTLKCRERAHAVGERHLRIHTVQLVDVDPLEAQAREASVARRTQMFRLSGVHWFGPGRVYPPLVAITSPFGYG